MTPIRFFLDNLWRWKCNINEVDLNPKRVPDPKTIAKLVWSEKFDKLAKDAMIMGYFRYGGLKDVEKYDYVKAYQSNLTNYERTGKLEYLVDARNFIMLEFIKQEKLGNKIEFSDDKEHYR